VLRLCSRRQRRLSSCARAGASRGGTLFFGVKTWRQEEIQQKARRCCAEDNRQEAPTLIVSFDNFFWALPIFRRKAVPLIIPVHRCLVKSCSTKKNLCSFLVVPLLTRHFEKEVMCAASHAPIRLTVGKVPDGQQDYRLLDLRSRARRLLPK
jgi:hypothetical protein